VYLHCPECRLTVYRPVADSAHSNCPRCGREALWTSPPFTRTNELKAVKAAARKTETAGTRA